MPKHQVYAITDCAYGCGRRLSIWQTCPCERERKQQQKAQRKQQQKDGAS